MILYFANRGMNILGFATTHKIGNISIVDDNRTEETETGISSLEITLEYNSSGRKKAEEMAESGNYILFSDGDEKKFYTIIEEEVDSGKKEVQIYAEDAGLDLINEIVGSFEAEEAHSPEWYINKYIKDSGFEIGTNEFPDSERKLKWDGEQTVTERLASIATGFGGFEVSYSFEISGLKVIHKYVNIYEKRGKDVSETLRIGRELKSIRTKKTIANLATALECKGGTPEGSDNPITLSGMEYDDGEFYVSGKKLCSRTALEKWSRYAWEEREGKGDGHIVQPYSYDTTDQETLCKHAITELKKIYDTEINFEIDINYLPGNIEVGDRVNIVDNEGELYVSTRILEFKKSVTRGEYAATLGEYLIKEKGIDDYLYELAEKVKDENSNTTLYTWIAYADDEIGTGITLDPTGKTWMGIAENRTVETPDISDPSVYKWSKIQGDQGEDGVSATSIVDEYYLSTSDTEVIGGTWSEEMPIWEKGKYIWKRTRTTWSYGSVTYAEPVLDKASNSANEAAGEAIEKADIAENAANEANQSAQNAQEKADIAHQAAQNAQNQATEANQAAQNAQNLAADAQAKADAANKDIATIKTETASIREDAAAIRTELQGQIDTVTETMEASYAKKTDVSTTEATLRAEWKKSAAEIQSTMESDYAKKTELTAVQADLQTQVTQNATNITTTASAIETVKINADNAVKNATEAKETAAQAQTAANNAVSTANTAQASADVAAQAAADAQAEATKAQTAADTAAKAAADADAIAQAAQKDLDEAKANLDAVTNRVGSTEEEIAAAQAAVNTAQAEADRANQAAQNAQSAATTAQNTADQAKTDAQTAQAAATEAKTNAENAKATADAAQAAADKANADLSNLANRVTEMSTKIDQNAEAINLAATKTEVTEKLSGYSTKEETQATIQLQADSIRTEVSNTFINLGMEGRNYILNTKLMEGYTTGGTAKIVIGEDGFAIGSFSAPASLGWGNQVIALPPIKFSLLRNKKVTFTVLVKSDDYEAYNADTTHGLMVSFALCTAEATSRTKYHDQQFYRSQLSAEWKKLTLTTTFSDSWFGSGTGTIDDTTRFLLQFFNYSTYSLAFKQIKLEIGDVATNYSEAPEDVDGAITNLKASLELKVNKDKLVSELNASADIIRFTGNRFIVDSTNLDITQDGLMEVRNGKFSGTVEVTGPSSKVNINYDRSTPAMFEDVSILQVVTGSDEPGNSVYANAHVGINNDSINVYGAYGTKFIGDPYVTITNTGIECVKRVSSTNAAGYTQSTIFSFSDTSADISTNLYVNGLIKVGKSIAPADGVNGSYACGLDANRWSTVYTKDVNANGVIKMPGITSSTSVTRVVYMGATAGQLYYKASISSRTIKHDIKPLCGNLSAEKLYNLDVVQFKYNTGILSEDDQRYMADMPGFIIEDLNDVYPIAVDKETDNVRDWAWNASYLIPPMLKLLQNHHAEITEIRSMAYRNESRMESLDYMLQQAFLKIAEQEKLIKQLQASS